MTKQTKPRTVSYLRVSTAAQDNEKFKRDIRAFANARDWGRVQFIEEKVSGMIPWKERKLGTLIDELQAEDRLIVPELSRLGRASLWEIMEILAVAKQKGIAIYDVKNGWELNGSLQSEVMAFAFSIAAKIERQMLIQRTAEGRRAAKARGVKFGRPPGTYKSKLDDYKTEIAAMLKTGVRQSYIAKKYNCTPATLCNWIKRHGISKQEEV
jgi:DNA invertase Pin-like site-specific DNA recombinase